MLIFKISENPYSFIKVYYANEYLSKSQFEMECKLFDLLFKTITELELTGGTRICFSD